MTDIKNTVPAAAGTAGSTEYYLQDKRNRRTYEEWDGDNGKAGHAPK